MGFLKCPRLLSLLAAVASTTLLISCGAGETDSSHSDGSGGESVTVNVGGLLYGPYDSVAPNIVRNERLFEEAGKELGLDIKVNYQFFPTGAQVVQGMTGGTLDIGDMGTTPLIGLVSQDQKVVPLALSTGKLRFVVVVREDSPFRNMQDLKGKRIGLTVGTDQEGFLDNIAQYHLGEPSAKDAFTLVNLQTPTQAASMPKGIDAAVTVSTAYLSARDKLGTHALVNSYGTTEDYYAGPEGDGAGLELEGASDSPYDPEAFLAHRGFWAMSEAMFAKSPKVATAWMIAQQRGLEKVNDMSAEEAAGQLSDVLGLSNEQGASVIEDDLLRSREFLWLTRGEALIYYLSTLDKAKAGQIDEPSSWGSTVDLFTKAAEQSKKAYEVTGSKATTEEFVDDSEDLRGPPIWQSEEWAEPSS